MIRLVYVLLSLLLAGCLPRSVVAFSSVCTKGGNVGWKNYDYGTSVVSSPLQKDFEKAGGVIYKTSVLTGDETQVIKQDITNLRLCSETTSSVARNRVGAVLSSESDTVRIIKEGSLNRLVERVAGDNYELSTNIPVEVRAYEKVGAGMEWHIDDVLYDPPQIEVVFTLENNSDCRTMWKENGPQHQKQKSIETDENSAILLRAGGVDHCVSSLKHGKRVIIKCAFRKVGSTFLENEQVLQFGKAASKKTKKQRGRRR
mmetsp:Transcript_1243/g.1698  ORF Transcript_1243/g.1698 Transcript_1243/m.1698 type:complete len:258 (-) Transcript_1243:151-924(-)